MTRIYKMDNEIATGVVERPRKSSNITRETMEFIAATIKTLDLSKRDKAHVVARFAHELARVNQRFNEDRFLEACIED